MINMHAGCLRAMQHVWKGSHVWFLDSKQYLTNGGIDEFGRPEKLRNFKSEKGATIHLSEFKIRITSFFETHNKKMPIDNYSKTVYTVIARAGASPKGLRAEMCEIIRGTLTPAGGVLPF